MEDLQHIQISEEDKLYFQVCGALGMIFFNVHNRNVCFFLWYLFCKLVANYKIVAFAADTKLDPHGGRDRSAVLVHDDGVGDSSAVVGGQAFSNLQLNADGRAQLEYCATVNDCTSARTVITFVCPERNMVCTQAFLC